VQEDAVHELGVVDRAADLLDEADVAQVDVVALVVDEAQDRVDGDRGEDGRVLRDDLGRERRRRGAQEVVAVAQVDGEGHLGEKLDDLGGGAGERLGDDGRVDALVEQLLGGAEERAGEDDDRGGAVSRLDVLRGREVDELLPEASESACGS